VDFQVKSQITANHQAAHEVTGAQKSLYEAADILKDLQKKLKSSLLTGTSDYASNDPP
jgi:flavoprotein